MGELHGKVEISQSLLIACSNSQSCRSDLSDPFGVCSSINEVFAHVWTLTAYISCRFFHFIEDLVFRDLDGWCSRNVLVNFFEQHRGSSCHSNTSISEIHSSFSKRYDDYSSTRVSGVGASDCQEALVVNKHSEVVEANYAIKGNPLIFQGLLRLSIRGIQFAWRLAISPWKCFISYIRCTQACVHSISSRVLRTLHGSSDDIGWLQNTPGMPAVEYGTARFLELLDGIRNGKHQLPNSFVYLLIPGLFSNHGPLYFVATKRFFSKMGLTCHIAKIHSEASVEHNAWELKLYIEELYWGSGKQVMMLGHSKGGVDAAAALSLYWSDLEGKVAGLALVQSPYGGTPLASDILCSGQIADRETRRIMELLICKLIKGDIRALEDLTYERRKEFILNHQLPKNIPLVSFHSEASLAPGVLATMTHIAHAELPWLPLPGFRGDKSKHCANTCRRVPIVIPISAAMALCALHLLLRYGERSDGLVTCRDAEVPGSVVVRPDRKLDHAWMVYSSNKKNPSDPDACDMSEALLNLLVELGKKMRDEENKA